MDYSNIEAINRINISAADEPDASVNVLFMYARSGETRDPQRCRVHSHTYFEIHAVFKGYIIYDIDGEELRVPSGEFVIIAPKQVHRVIAHSDDYIKFSIVFEVSENSEAYEVFDAKSQRTIPVNDAMCDDIDYIIEQANDRGMFCDVIIKKRLGQLIFVIAEYVSGSKNVKFKKEFSDDRLLKARKYIEDNANVFFSCSDIAEHCGISTKQLGRLFQKYRNESLLDFIHVQKISDARQMLVNTDELQETISKDLGFSSVHYFNKFFLHEVGMTPDEYRKQYSKIENRGNENE